MAESLYGPGGFYHRAAGGPGAHYRTSSTASPLFAAALAELVARADEALGAPDRLDVVEVGAARGALLTALDVALPAPLRERVVLTGMDLASRPPTVPAHLGWAESLTEIGPITGVVLSNEWLDNVPLDVVELTEDGPRLVEVSDDGEERLGPVPSEEDADWLAEWWPMTDPGERAELGWLRDESWAGTVRMLRRGVLVTVDYAHSQIERAAGAWAGGTLTGYREGRAVLPVPDGSCDLTAHVALDSVAAAGVEAGATSSLLTDQRTALTALGVDGSRPPLELAHSDARAYLVALQRTGEAAELLDRGGLGGFGWLMQGVGVDVGALIQAGPG